jgi:hypothetical protein
VTDFTSSHLELNSFGTELESARLELTPEAETEAEAEDYCRQPAGTLTPGIWPRWDPWPYICSMSRPMFCFVFPFVDPPY